MKDVCHDHIDILTVFDLSIAFPLASYLNHHRVMVHQNKRVWDRRSMEETMATAVIDVLVLSSKEEERVFIIDFFYCYLFFLLMITSSHSSS